jgi:hypothetical protein
VEILAAGDKRNVIALGAGPTNSFTQNLLIEVRHRAQYGEKLVEIADLINALRQSSPVKKPTHGIRLGMGSITLPLNTTTATAPPLTSMKRNGLLATFSLTCPNHSAKPS